MTTTIFGACTAIVTQADASAMKEVLVRDLGVPVENISLWLDSDATRSTFENELSEQRASIAQTRDTVESQHSHVSRIDVLQTKWSSVMRIERFRHTL